MELNQVVKKFFNPVFHNKGMFFRSFIQSTIRSVFDIFSILVFKHAGELVDGGDQDALYRLLIIYALVFCGYQGVKYIIRHYGWAEIYFNMLQYFYNHYLVRFVNLDNTVVDKVGTGRYIDIIKTGVHSRVEGLIDFFYHIPDLVFKIIFSVYLISLINTTFGLIFITGYLFVILFVLWLNRYAIQYRVKRRNEEIEITRGLVRVIMAKIEILFSKAIGVEMSKMSVNIHNAIRYNYTFNTYLRAMFNIPMFFVGSVGIFSLWYAWDSLAKGVFEPGLFLALLALNGYLRTTVTRSVEYFKNFTKQFVDIEKLWTYIDDEKKIILDAATGSYEYSHGTINFDGVSFAYMDGVQVFDNFSLQIQGGKKTALVGMSGSGKSTLIKLIAGYIMPDAGKVRVDGQDLSTVSLQSYYAHIGYLTQDPSVFDGTIRENLAYGMDLEPEKGEVERSIQLAKCERIYDLPHSLDTEIGERGVKLSGGQRQRLAIAKIFLKNPKIVLLDEPTSALDSFAEEAVTEAMNNLFVGRTVIIIAHRLQTVKHADDIIVLDNGTVIERGIHTDLVAAGGYYARMLELQSGF